MIENFKIVVPDTIDEYTGKFQALNNGIDRNKRETDNLVDIRNSLLPRLMSGKLRVI